MIGKSEFSKLYHCVYSLHYHLVLVTKYRRRVITRPMLERLREIARARCEGWGGELVELNGEPDHIHLLVSLPPSLELSGFVNNLKTTTSRLIRKEFADEVAKTYSKPVFWSRSYCIVSAGGAPLSIIRQYVEQQAGAE
jgi:putative transposase